MIYSPCGIKNISGGYLELHLKSFEIDESYTIPDVERMSWGNNDDVLSAIALFKIQVCNAIAPIDGIVNQVRHLRDELPKEMIIVTKE